MTERQGADALARYGKDRTGHRWRRTTTDALGDFPEA